MVAMTDKLSAKLALLSFLFTLVVVFIHSPHGGTDIIGQSLDIVLPGAITNVAVPFFFFCSGFLLAGGVCQPDWWRTALKKRIKTLLIPYLILNVVYWPIKFSVHTMAVKWAEANGQTMLLSWETPFEIVGIPFFHGPAIGPLWYVRCLLLFVLVSPLFVFTIRRSRMFAGLTFLGTVVVYFVWEAIKMTPCFSERMREFAYYGFSLWGVMFFVAGLCVRIWWRGEFSRRVGVVSLTLGLFGCIFVSCLGWHMPSRSYLLPCFMVIWGCLMLVPAYRMPKWLAENNFALYACHVPFFYFLSCGLKVVKVELPMTILSILYWIVAVIVILSLAVWLRRKFPRFAKLIFR